MPTVLVVEDDVEIRELVRDLIAGEGYAVEVAANGREALDYLRSAPAPPCLILLDLMMPVMSGPELLEIMSDDPSLASLPVVVVSAVADRGVAPGVKRFLRKPVSADLLRRVVKQYCGRRR